MSLSVARLANAISRLSVAHYATRDPKPVVRFGEDWTPPLPPREGLVHYIWRHRPADFEERYMMQIDDPKSYPFNIDQQVEADFRNTHDPFNDGKNEDGKYPPPPMPEYRRALIESRKASG